MKRPADFPPAVKSALALTANHRCVRPGCGTLTHAYHAASGRFMNLGIAAHDVPASRYGPRADDCVSIEQRRAYENGAWLCRTCAVTVDLLPTYFPVGTITSWQRDASFALANGILQPISQQFINVRDACAAANRFCLRLNHIGLVGRPPYLELSYLHVEDIRTLLRDCAHLGPLNDLSSLYPHTHNIQKQMLSGLRLLVTEVTASQLWTGYNDFKAYRSNGYGSAIESANKMWALWDDIRMMHQKLFHFAATGQSTASALNLW